MGVFDFLTGQSGDGGYTPPSPDQQGWAAFTQAQLGQPSKYKIPAWQLLAQGMLNGGQAYKGAQNTQQLADAAQSPDAPSLMAALSKIQDPAIQQEVLKNRLAALTPKYEVTKDAFGNPIAYNSMNPSQTMPVGGAPNQFGTGGTVGSPSVPGGTSGDDFLKTLDPRIATQVKGIAEGRIAPPGGMALKTPYWQQMLQAVSQYDPSFDAVNYNARSKVYQDTTSGKTSQNIKSIETALNTLSQAQDASEKLGGVDNASILNSPLNYIHQLYASSRNDPDLNTYNQVAKASADETARAVIGAGGTGGDRDARLVSASQSPAARKAAFQAQAQELASRLDPIANTYNQGMGTTKGGIQLLSPSAQANYQKLVGEAPSAVASGVKPGPQAQQQSQKVMQVSSPNDPNFKLLPSGAQFMDETGQLRIKH